VKLGVIADDFTGASDVGLILAGGGLRTVQYVGVPDRSAEADVEAGVVSLKSRSVPVDQAVERSLAALAWLRDQGCTRYLFKYCSTFDSTPEGNIGPVLDALCEALDVDGAVIVCPAFPATGRTVYQGHLFVGDALLNESGLQNHPLNPMTDADLRRWLARQTSRGTGHLPLPVVRAGAARERFAAEVAAGRPYVVCDAVDDADLVELVQAGSEHRLVSGGSGIALGLPALHGAAPGDGMAWSPEARPALALCGSCSVATRGQLARHRRDGGAQRRIEVADLIDGTETVGAVLDWAAEQAGRDGSGDSGGPPGTIPVVYTSDDPDSVRAAQQRFGAAVAAEAIESFFAELARRAVDAGVGRLVVAGGETSGAVVTALGLTALDIGPSIDPGVPALLAPDAGADGQPGIAMALKSGNFGRERFFAHATAVLATGADPQDDTSTDSTS